jgi:hypothetical protein
MTVQHADLFHCLACGHVAYEPHGGPAPDCCGEPMVRAVADVIQEPATTDIDRPVAEPTEPSDLAEHALFAEVVELSQWCHGLRDVDIARREELADRLAGLQRALSDRVESPEHVLPSLREQGGQLLASIAQFVTDLRNQRSSFTSWAQICDRLDVLVAQFRHYAHTEGNLPPGRLRDGGGTTH